MFTLMPYITKLITLPPYVTTFTLRGLLFYLQVIYNLLSKDKYPRKLALIWVGFLGVRFEVGGWHVSTQAYIVSGNILFSTKALLILLISAFFPKKSAFLAKIVPLLKAIVWELCQSFFSSVFTFCKVKG